jgi:limonene-1,2-epoxide hydrolase
MAISTPRRRSSSSIRRVLLQRSAVDLLAATSAGATAQAPYRWFRRSGCDNARAVLEFWEAWGTRDEEAIMSYFSDDATYHNVPVAPIVGAVAIRSTVQTFLQLFQSVRIETLSSAASGEVVHTERVDHFRVYNGNAVTLPVAGTLYMAGGKIYLWRDYFDLAAFESQSGIRLGASTH